MKLQLICCTAIMACIGNAAANADTYLLWDWSPQTTGYAEVANTSAWSNSLGFQTFAEKVSFPAWVRIVAMDNYSWDKDGKAGDPAITSLYNQVGGLPGPLIKRFESAVSIVDELGSGDSNNRKHVPFSQDVFLEPSVSYWIGLASTQAAPFAQMGLPYILQPGITINPPGDGQMAAFSGDVFTGLSGFAQGDMAFRLQGQLLGDADSNQRIDGADFLEWQRQVGATGLAAYSQADFSGDGIVSGVDLGYLKSGFGAVINLVNDPSTTAVPSPSSSTLALMGLAALIAIGRSRERRWPVT